MESETASGIKVELADGVKGDITELTAISGDANPAQQTQVDALKRRIAELFLECEANPLRAHRKAKQRT